MNNKKFIVIFASVAAAAALSACAPAAAGRPLFDAAEYSVNSGDRILADRSAEYRLVGSVPAGVAVDATSGVITYGAEIPDGTQVLLVASTNGKSGSPVVVTLRNQRAVPEVTVLNPSVYLRDGDSVLVSVGGTDAAVGFTLASAATGVSVDYVTGKVSFTSAVQDGATFTVAATARGVRAEKTFTAMTERFVEVGQDTVIREKNSFAPAMFRLDYGADDTAAKSGALGLIWQNRLYTEADGVYTYDRNSATVTVAATFLNGLLEGENTLHIATARNPVSVAVRVATKFVATAQDLASVGESVEALKGYYIQVEDIDLGDYLKNDALGWDPIGKYRDVLDGTATAEAFKGVYDGNGHTVSGLWMKRQFTVSGFNAGLFGYADTASEIRNLTVRSSQKSTVCSYSGGIAGVSAGIMENCLAAVDISSETGENVYVKTGGLVGRNAGTIRNCISIGAVASDDNVGALAGSNEGEIVNCYAVKSGRADKLVGDGISAQGSRLFDDLDALRRFDFGGLLGAEWTLADHSVPATAEITPEQCVRKLEITNTDTVIRRGKARVVATAIYPSSFAAEYADRIVYTVTGDCTMLGATLLTENSTAESVVVTATLTLPYGVLTAQKTFEIVS